MKHHVDVISEPVLPNCSEPVCTGPLSNIYCSGKLVHAAWAFGLQNTCPGDMMLQSPDAIINALNKLEYPLKRDDFKRFCSQNFAPFPYLKVAKLIDWTEDPPNLRRVKDTKLRSLAKRLNGIWKFLGREFDDKVREKPEIFPVLPVPNPFVVPGGFFQMYFYWDSYWIMKGLLFSNMTVTVRNMIENFATVIRYHGFIPNAGNIQLSRRSQPPLFTQMLADYYQATGNETFLSECLPLVDAELSWWLANRSVVVSTDSSQHYTMFQYRAASNCPRPENYLVDLYNGLKGTGGAEFIWSSIASACESGLDFSSRWFAYSGAHSPVLKFEWGRMSYASGTKSSTKLILYRADSFKLSLDFIPDSKYSIRTNKILPVDLNVFMVWNYDTAADLYHSLGSDSKSQKYRKMADELWSGIEAVLWNEAAGVWFDYDLAKRKHRRKFYPSNVFPLLLGRAKSQKADRVNYYLRYSSGGALDYRGGIPSSLDRECHEQWDFPNGWAPSTHLFVESLRLSSNEDLYEIALQTANKFVRTVYNGLINPSGKRPAACWEKYDIRFDDGRPGVGGEYPVQMGFGWTNGAVLDMILRFNIDDEESFRGFTFMYNHAPYALLVALVCLTFSVWCVFKILRNRRVTMRSVAKGVWLSTESIEASRLIDECDEDN
ncbi:unnamed protein product [Anisakis simplex]|uniref:Trehalase n=1 Tax=Anisakis simplex TaxID=6269 RepID=A0A3P6QSF2_ANISI|nr:unnamed protein product [Anisakis simplex]